MQSYNKALFMRADIQRFKASERRFAEATAFRTEGREISNYIAYSNFVKQDIASSLFSDTAGTQLAPEFRRRFIDRIGTRATDTTFDESAFQEWYGGIAGQLGLNPDPDDPKHKYDYRAAFSAGVTPDEAGHFPSEFKDPDHPNRFVDGIDTITGKPSALTRIGKARFQATTFKGEPAYRDTKTGEHFKRSPFKPGIKGIGKKFIAGKPSSSETEFFKLRKIMEDLGSDPITVRHARRLIEENTSAPAQEYTEQLKRDKVGVTSLKERLLANPQDTDRAFLDNTISTEAFNQAVADYAADLMDIGYTAEEAQAEAEAEAERLRAEDAPGRRAFPEKQETIPDQAGASGGVPTISTQDEYNALPSGTQYRDANGNIGTKR